MDQNARDERFHQIEEKTDSRSKAQHDRDRILLSTALRRLAGVTQVVDPSEGHIYHNRLTHTLKVAQIARRIAEKLRDDDKQLTRDLGGIDPDVAEAAALAHDLGHSPFGHLGEAELDILVRNCGLEDGYEGNPQAFRILTQLEPWRFDVNGLNLTRATLNSVLKYPRYRSTTGEAFSKWGAYSTETPEYIWTREYSGGTEIRSLEAEIMDWADDIAFSVHDVEDFYRADLIPMDFLASSRAERTRLIAAVLDRWGEDKRPEERAAMRSHDELLEIFEKSFYWLPFSSPFHNTYRAKLDLRLGTSALIDRYIGGITLNPNAIKNNAIRTVKIDPDLGAEIKILKELTWRYVIHNQALATQQFGKRRVIRELFAIFYETFLMDTKASKNNDNLRHILPEDYEERLEAIGKRLPADPKDLTNTRAKARLTADIISSLADSEALALHRRLMGLNFGSVTDKLSIG